MISDALDWSSRSYARLRTGLPAISVSAFSVRPASEDRAWGSLATVRLQSRARKGGSQEATRSRQIPINPALSC